MLRVTVESKYSGKLDRNSGTCVGRNLNSSEVAATITSQARKVADNYLNVFPGV